MSWIQNPGDPGAGPSLGAGEPEDEPSSPSSMSSASTTVSGIEERIRERNVEHREQLSALYAKDAGNYRKWKLVEIRLLGTGDNQLNEPNTAQGSEELILAFQQWEDEKTEVEAFEDVMQEQYNSDIRELKMRKAELLAQMQGSTGSPESEPPMEWNGPVFDDEGPLPRLEVPCEPTGIEAIDEALRSRLESIGRGYLAVPLWGRIPKSPWSAPPVPVERRSPSRHSPSRHSPSHQGMEGKGKEKETEGGEPTRITPLNERRDRWLSEPVKTLPVFLKRARTASDLMNPKQLPPLPSRRDRSASAPTDPTKLSPPSGKRDRSSSPEDPKKPNSKGEPATKKLEYRLRGGALPDDEDAFADAYRTFCTRKTESSLCPTRMSAHPRAASDATEDATVFRGREHEHAPSSSETWPLPPTVSDESANDGVQVSIQRSGPSRVQFAAEQSPKPSDSKKFIGIYDSVTPGRPGPPRRLRSSAPSPPDLNIKVEPGSDGTYSAGDLYCRKRPYGWEPQTEAAHDLAQRREELQAVEEDNAGWWYANEYGVIACWNREHDHLVPPTPILQGCSAAQKESTKEAHVPLLELESRKLPPPVFTRQTAEPISYDPIHEAFSVKLPRIITNGDADKERQASAEPIFDDFAYAGVDIGGGTRLPPMDKIASQIPAGSMSSSSFVRNVRRCARFVKDAVRNDRDSLPFDEDEATFVPAPRDVGYEAASEDSDFDKLEKAEEATQKEPEEQELADRRRRPTLTELQRKIFARFQNLPKQALKRSYTSSSSDSETSTSNAVDTEKSHKRFIKKWNAQALHKGWWHAAWHKGKEPPKALLPPALQEVVKSPPEQKEIDRPVSVNYSMEHYLLEARGRFLRDPYENVSDSREYPRQFEAFMGAAGKAL